MFPILIPSHLPSHAIPLGHPSAPAPSTLYHESNLDWRFVSHVIIYKFQCHSPISSSPCPLPQSPKDCSTHLCLFCGLMLKFDIEQNASLWLPWRCVIPSVETLFIWRSPWPFLGFPDSLVVKESVCNAGGPGLIPGSGRSPGEGIGHPLVFLGFPYGSVGKEFACNSGKVVLIPGLGRYPGEGQSYPL